MSFARILFFGFGVFDAGDRSAFEIDAFLSLFGFDEGEGDVGGAAAFFSLLLVSGGVTTM